MTPSPCGVTTGCPIRRSPDQGSFDSSPGLIAAYHVLHRLSTPRHPPCTLSSLIAWMTDCPWPCEPVRAATRRRPFAPSRTSLRPDRSCACVKTPSTHTSRRSNEWSKNHSPLDIRTYGSIPDLACASARRPLITGAAGCPFHDSIVKEQLGYRTSGFRLSYPFSATPHEAVFRTACLLPALVSHPFSPTAWRRDDLGMHSGGRRGPHVLEPYEYIS